MPRPAATSRTAVRTNQPFGVSTMTLVALTTATASDPTSSPRSRTASDDSSDTTRCGPGLDVDLRHDAVDLHARHEPDEPVARAREHIGGIGCRVRVVDGACGERLTGDLGGTRVGGRQQTLVDPPAHGVVAHAEQPCGLGDLVARHAPTISPQMRRDPPMQPHLRQPHPASSADPPLSGGEADGGSCPRFGTSARPIPSAVRRARCGSMPYPPGGGGGAGFGCRDPAPGGSAGRSLGSCPSRRSWSRSPRSAPTSARAPRGTRASPDSASSASAGSPPRTSPSSAPAGSAPPSCSPSRRPASATLTVIDDDVVESSNLQRQVMHRRPDVGSAKVDSAVRAAADLSPETVVRAVRERLDAENAARAARRRARRDRRHRHVRHPRGRGLRVRRPRRAARVGRPCRGSTRRSRCSGRPRPPERAPVRLGDLYPHGSVGEVPTCARRRRARLALPAGRGDLLATRRSSSSPASASRSSAACS